MHIAQARQLIESKDPVDLSFFTKKGEIIHARRVVCLSSNYKRNTFNIKFLENGEIRKVRATLMFNISGEEIYL